MDSAPERTPNYAPELIVAIGYVLLCLVVIGACSYAYITALRQGSARKAAPAPHPTSATPQAHYAATPDASTPGVYLEDFSNSGEGQYGDWRKTDRSHVIDGKLVIENPDDGAAFIMCKACLIVLRPYYVQAEFTTDQPTADEFGLLINSRYNSNDVYLFGVSTEGHEYDLVHYGTDDGWTRRAAGISRDIRSYPAVNTLAAYVNGSLVELYVNGHLVESYQETGVSFERGLVGFYAEGHGHRLSVDNLVIQMIGDY